MREREQSAGASFILNLLEYYAKQALTSPHPDEILSKLSRYRRYTYDETEQEKIESEEIRRNLELPGIKVFTVEDRTVLAEKSNSL